MAELHIEDFCQDVARILLRLYRHFPRKATVYVEDISGPDQPDEFGLHSERFSACFGAMLWLAQEGYLRYENTIGQSAIDQAVLSQMCVTLLSAPGSTAPPAGGAAAGALPSNAAALRHTLRHGSSTTLAELVQQLLLDARRYR